MLTEFSTPYCSASCFVMPCRGPRPSEQPALATAPASLPAATDPANPTGSGEAALPTTTTTSTDALMERRKAKALKMLDAKMIELARPQSASIPE